jgi:ComF family protein
MIKRILKNLLESVRNIKKLPVVAKISNRINSLRAVIDIFYPNLCFICRRYIPSNSDGQLICDLCWQSIERNTPPFCYRCGAHLSFKRKICPYCSKKVFYFDRLWSACIYTGVMEELICLFKYKGYDFLGKKLSKILIDFIKEFRIPVNLIDWIVPIPLHPRKLREREFNQSEILAKELAKEFNLRLSCNLIRIKDTIPQAGLPQNKRFQNVKDVFGVKRESEFRDKNILLIDDVSTTGATLSWGSFALRKAGAKGIFCLTLARTKYEDNT